MDLDKRIQRLISRNSLSKEDAIKRIRDVNIKGDFVVANNSTFEDLENQVKNIIKKIINEKD